MSNFVRFVFATWVGLAALGIAAAVLVEVLAGGGDDVLLAVLAGSAAGTGAWLGTRSRERSKGSSALSR